MKSAKELRREAWVALGEGQYWPFVGAALVLMLITGIMIVPWVLACVGGSLLVNHTAGGPFAGMDAGAMALVALASVVCAIPFLYVIGFATWGTSRMALAVGRRELKFGLFSSGWGHGWKMLWVTTVQFTYVQLWGLLLVVPGVVKAFSYALTEFVAVDHPDWTANQCITESRRLMAGHRWRLLCLGVSFIGWWLLTALASMLPCGSLAQVLFTPYYMSAFAAFYEERKAECGGAGI